MLLISNYVNSRIASDQRATVMSIYALATGLASSLAVPLFGYLADERSLQFMYGAAAVFAATTLPFILLAWRRAEHREAAAEVHIPLEGTSTA
jgi:MFS family permease